MYAFYLCNDSENDAIYVWRQCCMTTGFEAVFSFHHVWVLQLIRSLHLYQTWLYVWCQAVYRTVWCLWWIGLMLNVVLWKVHGLWLKTSVPDEMTFGDECFVDPCGKHWAMYIISSHFWCILSNNWKCRCTYILQLFSMQLYLSSGASSHLGACSKICNNMGYLYFRNPLSGAIRLQFCLYHWLPPNWKTEFLT